MEVQLVNEEIGLKVSIEDKLSQLKAIHHGSMQPENKIEELYNEMGTLAHSLHIKLKARDIEPIHHRYMIKNRRMPSDSENFYMHIHPVEDLLAFIKDQNANIDPEDKTIGDKFKFTVYSNRWGHDDTYVIKRNKSGWEVIHTHHGDCDKEGNPYLYSNFNNDSVYYPDDLPYKFEWLWNKAQTEGLSHDTVQTALDELAIWVNITSKGVPKGGIWECF